jgi:hypothetical protein
MLLYFFNNLNFLTVDKINIPKNLSAEADHGSRVF